MLNSTNLQIFDKPLQQVEGKPYAINPTTKSLIFQPTHNITDNMTQEEKAKTQAEFMEYQAAKYAHLFQK